MIKFEIKHRFDASVIFTADDDSGGGFASAQVLAWAEEWLAITSPAPVPVEAA